MGGDNGRPKIIVPGRSLHLPGPSAQQQAEAAAVRWMRDVQREIERLRNIIAAWAWREGGSVRLTAEDMRSPPPLDVRIAPHEDGGWVVTAEETKPPEDRPAA